MINLLYRKFLRMLEDQDWWSCLALLDCQAWNRRTLLTILDH